jgi:hypothetical protein
MVFWRRQATKQDKAVTSAGDEQPRVQQPRTPRSWEPGFLEYWSQCRRAQAAQVQPSTRPEELPPVSLAETCRDVWAAVLSNLQPRDLARAGVRVYATCKSEELASL